MLEPLELQAPYLTPKIYLLMQLSFLDKCEPIAKLKIDVSS